MPLDGATIDLPGMSTSEALSLRLVEDTIKSLLPLSMLEGLEGRFRQAEKQLVALGKENRNTKWASKVRVVTPTMPLIPPVIDPAVLATIQEALLSDMQVEVAYQAMNNGEDKQVTLHPLALVHRGPVIYLVATAFEYDDIRLFAMHRIHKAWQTFETAKRPANFDLDEYIQAGGLQFSAGKSIRLSAWVSDYLARILEETPLSTDQQLKADGDLTKLTASVADSWQLIWWLMSYGDNIEVIAPVALRRKISGLLADAAARYECH